MTFLYATDEDIALRAPSDFMLICPRDQRLTTAGDGAFDASDRWALRSSSINFAASGLVPGHVIQLLGPTTAFKAPGELLVVDTVDPDLLRLRRMGQPTGVGSPPAPLDGLTGVEFLAVTLGPQIARATADLNSRYGIDGLGPVGNDDARELRDAAVLTVLHRRYQDLSQAQGDRHHPLAALSARIGNELDELLARTAIRLGDSGFPGLTATRFHTRLSR